MGSSTPTRKDWPSPIRGFYRLACNRLDIPSERVVFLDDNPRCVDGARAAGLHAIQFVDNRQSIAALDELLDR